MPSNWLRGIITFIRNSKDRYDINNYRQPTITNVIYKIWDTVIYNRLKPYLQ